MKKTWTRFEYICILLFLLFGLIQFPVKASPGIPGSPEFGIGVHISPSADTADAALTYAAGLKPDWLAVTIDWEAINPEPGVEDWSRLDRILEKTSVSLSAVMLSLTNPPAWALSPSGPDPAVTASFIAMTTARYGSKIGAIELFPSPNTRSGWGAAPDPVKYLALYREVAQGLANNHSAVLLVSGGLEANFAAETDSMRDMDFLTGLYSAGASTTIPVIGLRYSAVHGLPSAHPSRNSNTVLRHYEDIRSLMTSSGHTSGILWITYLGFPPGTTAVEQTEWLAEAYPQIRAQLYIGTAFLQGINTCSDDPAQCGEVSLLSQDGREHPFSPVLHGILAHNAPKLPENRPGRGKSDIFNKPR